MKFCAKTLVASFPAHIVGAPAEGLNTYVCNPYMDKSA